MKAIAPSLILLFACCLCSCSDPARIAAEQEFRKHIAELQLAAGTHSYENLDALNAAANAACVTLMANRKLLAPEYGGRFQRVAELTQRIQHDTVGRYEADWSNLDQACAEILHQ